MYSSVNFPVQPHLPLVKSDSPQAIASAESNGKVQEIPASLRHLPDSTECPEHPLDKRQITTQTSCVVKAGPEQSPTKFQENDLLLVYPCNSVRRVTTPTLDLKINPEELKNRLDYHITGFLRERWISGHRKGPATQEEKKSLADSILARLPAELTEFLNKDWSDKEWFAPDEYQALARFHSAIILLEDEDLDYRSEKEEDEFNEFFRKECLPLRAGWSEDEEDEIELELIQYWLNEELQRCQDYPEAERMNEYIKTCHYGIFKADCVTVCDECIYRITENWKPYGHIKMLMSQGKGSP
ncbi:hypothetical protein [Endozoicomonas sp. ALB115]|uniref:hypothetical protein n=1 Tax=Endozoicomonas sp. ALB115 TaxID=3403074 RepID=UPI003BB60400